MKYISGHLCVLLEKFCFPGIGSTFLLVSNSFLPPGSQSQWLELQLPPWLGLIRVENLTAFSFYQLWTI